MFKSFAPAAFVVLALSSAAAGAPGDARYARPGQLVSAGPSVRLNLYCLGEGAPAVVFDSGFEDWAPAWAVVQPRVAKWTRACAYDRAGAGFSDPGPLPRTSVRIAGELRTALRNAGIAGPYILVGHAFGADNVRTFADLYMPDVAGLVLVEGDTVDLEPADMQNDDHLGEIDYVRQLRACRDAIAAGKPLPLLPAPPGQPHRTCAQQFFRGLPEAAWSAELNAKLLQIANTKLAMYDAYASEMEQMAADEAFLKQHVRSFGDRPIRILSTGNHGVGSLGRHRPTSLAHLRYEYEVTLAQSRLLSLSTNAKQIFATNSSEYILFDEPDTVVNAIREVFNEAGRVTPSGGNGPAALPPAWPRPPATSGHGR
jgi:pimeloyl-ACP methyl ester carboxylesterase